MDFLTGKVNAKSVPVGEVTRSFRSLKGLQ